jgi:hypothetical protein
VVVDSREPPLKSEFVVVFGASVVVVVVAVVVDSRGPSLKSEFVVVSGASVIVVVVVVVDVSQVSMSATLIDGPHKSTLTF